MSLRKIHLHGKLGKKYGREFTFAVATALEAVRAFAANFPGFLDDLKTSDWRVVRGDKKTGLHLDLEDMATFNLGAGELHFIPAARGAKRPGLIKIVAGVAITAAAVALAPMTGGASLMGLATATGGLTWAGNLALMGVGLTLSGVASLLAPKEHPQNSQTAKADVALGPQNSFEQGNPVPLIYGEVICGSQVVSSGLTLTAYSKTPDFNPNTSAGLLGSNVTQGAT